MPLAQRLRRSRPCAVRAHAPYVPNAHASCVRPLTAQLACASVPFPPLAGVVSAVEGEFDALALKKNMTRAGEEPRLRVAR